MADLSNVVRMLIHQLDATRSYLLPGYCDEDEKARAVIAFAESALAAEPPAPAEPDTDAVLILAAIIRKVDGSNSLGAAALAEAILAHPNAASVFQPTAPAPAADGERDHVPGAGNMVAANEEREEREELARWLEFEADNAQELGCATIYDHDRLRWVAGYLRQLAPAPAPAADGEREELARKPDVCLLSNMTASQLARAAALLREARPQPPQANTTHPTPTEPPTND